MNYARRPGIDSKALARLAARERESFTTTHRRVRAAREASAAHWLNGVPMHWMRDWSTPHPLFVRKARGVEVEDVDGNTYIDFCFGDTGAMFGHSPPAIARALAETGATGITSMLPAERVARVGEKLAKLFGLPFWQMTQTATDANRAALRWARAITGRQRILVFDGCYHGTVDETLVRALPDMKDKGGTRARAGLIGMNHDVSVTTDAVPFNDIAAVERVLARSRTAAVIAEPVMTNIGMVLPEEGFLHKLRELTRRHARAAHHRRDAHAVHARAAVMRARRTSSPTSGCAARRSPAACPARCSASPPRSRPACAACRKTAPAGIRAWAPRSRPMRWRSPASKPAR